MTTLQITHPTSDIAWTDTYYNGGVEGSALAAWFQTQFAAHFDAMDFTADLPEPAPAASPAPVTVPAQELCATCRLCVDGCIFAAVPEDASSGTRVPGVTYECMLLRNLRVGEVSAEFAAQTVQDAHIIQARAIDGFCATMPDHFGTLRPTTALDAQEHYVQGRALGIDVNKAERNAAWFHFDTYRGFIRLNFESGFLER